MSCGRLFILTSRRRGRVERSGNEPAAIFGQCEKVSFDSCGSWLKLLGRDMRLGECEMTVRVTVSYDNQEAENPD